MRISTTGTFPVYFERPRAADDAVCGSRAPTGRAISLLVFACGLLAASPCSAHSWGFVTASGDGLMRFYADTRDMVVAGDDRRVRLLFDYTELQQDPDTLIEHRSTIELASVDCRDRRLAAIEATSYSRNMGRGAAVVRNPADSAGRLRYVHAAPGSIDDKVVTFVCTARRSQTSKQPAH